VKPFYPSSETVLSTYQVKPFYPSSESVLPIKPFYLSHSPLYRYIKSAVFDRGGFVYHGRVKAVAEACREAGMEF
jgi:hypothetical protein